MPARRNQDNLFPQLTISIEFDQIYLDYHSITTMATTAHSLVATPASLNAVSVNPENPYASPTALFSIISSGIP